MSGIADSSGISVSSRLPKASRWVLISILITNIGNGMYMLSLGKLLYDSMRSAAAFGIVILLEYITTFLFQLLAGSIVDRGNPKAMCIQVDLIRGVFICIASLMLGSSFMYWWIFASAIVINFAKPFYRSAIFVIGPNIVPPEQLTRYNSLFNTSLQIGQLLGVALAAPIIQYFGSSVSFGLNGVSYLLAASAIWFIPALGVERKQDSVQRRLLARLITDWQEIGHLLRTNVGFGCHIVLGAGDYLAVSLINLSLVPMVDSWCGGNTFWLSAFDGFFALGAIVSTAFTSAVIRRIDIRNTAWVGMGGQAILFALLAGTRNPHVAMAIMFGMGMMNTFSITVFSSNLQRRSQGPIKGRIASVRNISVALLASAFVPIVVSAHHASLANGLLASAAICGAFYAVAFILSRHRFLGTALLEAQA